MGVHYADRFDWSDSAIEALKREWAKGTPVNRIMAILGAPTRNVVIGKAHRLGLDKRKSPIAKAGDGDAATGVNISTERYRAFWAEHDHILIAGYSDASTMFVPDIARQIGVSRQTVTERARVLGLTHPWRFGRGTERGWGGSPQKRVRSTDSGPRALPNLAERQAARAVPVAPESRNLALADLDIGFCKFPTSPHDAPHGQHRFCGAKIATEIDAGLAGGLGLPYCAFHQRVAVRQGYTIGVPDKRAA